VDASNYIRGQITTGGARVGSVHGLHRAGALTQQLLDSDQYAPGSDLDYRVAMRLTGSAFNIAGKDTVGTEQAIASLVDVSGADLSLCDTGFAGHIGLLRVAAADIGDAGLAEFVA